MPASSTAIELTIAAALAAAEKKADEIIALDVSERIVLTDAFLVVSGSTERQVSAIVDGIEDALHERGVKAVRKEGVSTASPSCTYSTPRTASSTPSSACGATAP